MEGVEQLTKSVETLQGAFNEFQKDHKKALNDNKTASESKITELAETVTKSLEQIQERTAKLEAVAERVGAGEGESDDNVKEAFVSFLRKGDSITPAERDVLVNATKGMSTDDNPNGGYLVPAQAAGVINGQIFETSPLRRIASVMSTSAKSATFDLDDDEASARWEGEGGSSGETDTPKLGKIEIVARKMEAEPAITTELLQDAAVDVESWLSGKVADKFSRLENTAFVNGSGPLQPRGFLTYSAWTTPGTYQRNALEQIVNGSTSKPTIDGLIDLQGSLKEDYQARAAWVMKRSTLVAIMKLKGTEHYHFLNLQPSVGPQGNVLGMEMLGKPIVLLNDMPAVASNSLSIGYGDFSRGYRILDRVGISVLRDQYTTKGKVKFYTTKRVGGAVTNFEAIKLLKFATN